MYQFIVYLFVALIWCEKQALVSAQLTQQDCPFPSCKCTSYEYDAFYYVLCDQNSGIVRGNSNITKIETLAIYNISSFSFQTFANLSITSLYLKFDYIESLPANLFDGVISLPQLFLSFNNLTTFEPGLLSNIKDLNTLTFYNDEFCETAPDFGNELNNLSQLKKLTIPILYNEKIINSMDSINNLESLQLSFINFNFNSILNNTSSTFFPANNSLLFLGLSNSGIEYIEPHTFQALVKLTYLELSGNQIEDVSFLQPLVSIQRIGLAINRIKFINNVDFSKFANLNTLGLGNNLINQIDSRTFENNTALNSLDLMFNYISPPSYIFNSPYSYLFLLQFQNQHGALTELSDWTFNFTNAINIRINLNTANSIKKLGDQVFCGLRSTGSITLVLDSSTFNLVHKCQLKQPKFGTSLLYWMTTGPVPCELISFAKNLNIEVRINENQVCGKSSFK